MQMSNNHYTPISYRNKDSFTNINIIHSNKAIIAVVGTYILNEIMDNVIQHSTLNQGFVMAQIQKESKNINVCIFDYGLGIYQTLKKRYNPRSAIDAISLSVQEGVTRDKEVGQGNGMWGLYNIVNLNTGHLSIISGNGGLLFKVKKTTSLKHIIMLNQTNQATTINFHLNLNKQTSITDAIKGYTFPNLYIENLENSAGQIVYKIGAAESGTGTRESGEAIRIELINIYKEAEKSIAIDFENVGIISSSFADELIGKLIMELGFFQFQKIFHITNMNPTIQSILHRSIGQRFAENYTT